MRGFVTYRTNTRLVSNGRKHTVDLVLGFQKKDKKRKNRKNDLQIWSKCKKSPVIRGVAKENGIAINPADVYTVGYANNIEEFEAIVLIIENKSLMTAHRNVFNRTRILKELSSFLSSGYGSSIRIATWLQGTSQAYVNPDRLKWAKDTVSALCAHNPTKLKAACKVMDNELATIEASLGHAKSYASAVLRVNSKLYDMLVSTNKLGEPQKTMKDVIAEVGGPRTREGGYDALIFQFVKIDNILEATLDEPSYFRDEEYSGFKYANALDIICKKYSQLRT